MHHVFSNEKMREQALRLYGPALSQVSTVALILSILAFIVSHPVTASTLLALSFLALAIKSKLGSNSLWFYINMAITVGNLFYAFLRLA